MLARDDKVRLNVLFEISRLIAHDVSYISLTEK